MELFELPLATLCEFSHTQTDLILPPVTRALAAVQRKCMTSKYLVLCKSNEIC